MSIPGDENLEQWRPTLMRYAVLQLRDPQLAEGIVRLASEQGSMEA